MNGWIHIHKKILEWEWYDDANTMRLFIHCLLKANWRDQMWHGVLIKRGQFITSIGHLSKELKLGAQSVRTSIIKLKSTNEITSKTTNKFHIITVLNWDKYQTLTNKPTNDQQTTNKRLTTTEEYKKNKNISAKAESLLTKNKKMRTYNENEPYKEPEIDIETDTYIKPTPKVIKPRESKHLKLAEAYINYRKFTYKTEVDRIRAVRRYMKPASELLNGHTSEEILECMKWCKEKYPEWSLETIVKKIDEYKTYANS